MSTIIDNNVKLFFFLLNNNLVIFIFHYTLYNIESIYFIKLLIILRYSPHSKHK